MYSFSFEPKPDWTHMWSFQPEIFDYLKGVTDKYGLRRYIRFGAHVDRAHWDEDEIALARVHRPTARSTSRSSWSPAPAACTSR